MRVWLKRTAIAACVPVAIAGGAAFVLCTTPGLNGAAALAERYVPGLTIGHLSGRIDELKGTGLVWSMPGVTVRVESLEWSIPLLALTNQEAAIERLALSGVEVEVETAELPASDPAAEEAPAAAVELPAPWRARLGRLILENAHAKVDGHDVALGRFETGIEMEGRALTLRPTLLKDVTLALLKPASATEPVPGADVADAAAPAASKASKFEEVKAPAVFQETEAPESTDSTEAPRPVFETAQTARTAQTAEASGSNPTSSGKVPAPASSSSSASTVNAWADSLDATSDRVAPRYTGPQRVIPKRGLEKSIAELVDAFFAKPVLTELPTVSLPIDVALEELKLENVVWTNAADWGVPVSTLKDLRVVAAAKTDEETGGAKLDLTTFDATLPDASLALAFRGTLGGKWPLKAEFEAGIERSELGRITKFETMPAELAQIVEANEPETGGERIRLKAKLDGALMKRIVFDADLAGLLRSDVIFSGDTALAEAKLPLRLDLSLPAFTLPAGRMGLTKPAPAYEAKAEPKEGASIAAADVAKKPDAAQEPQKAPAASSGDASDKSAADLLHAEDDVVELTDLRLIAGGDADAYYLEFSTGVFAEASGAGLAAPFRGDVVLRGAANLNGIRLEELSVAGSEGTTGKVTLAGGVGWRKGFVWRGRLETNPEGVDARAMLPSVPTVVKGGFNSIFTGDKSGMWRATVADVDLTGTLAGAEVKAAGGAWITQERELGFDAFEARLGRNVVTVDGRLQGVRAFDLNVKVDAPGLENTIPGLKGRASGHVKLLGTAARPMVDANLEASGLGWNDLSVEKATLVGKVGNRISEAAMRRVIEEARAAKAARDREIAKRLAEGLPSEGMSSDDAAVAKAIDTALRQGEFAGSMTLGVRGLAMGEDVKYESIDLKTTGRETNHTMTLDVKGEPVSGHLKVAGALNRSTLDWKGSLAEADLETPAGRWVERTPMSLSWQQKTKNFTAGAHCWTHEFAEVCVPEPIVVKNAGAAGHAVVELTKLNLDVVKPYLPKRRDTLTGTVTARVAADWTKPISADALPNVTAAVEADDIKYQTRIDGAPFPFSVDEFTMTAQFTGERASLGWNVRPAENGRVSGLLNVDAPMSERRLSGGVKAEGVTPILLRPLLARGEKAEGLLEADLSFGGTVASPELKGEVRFLGVDVDAAALPIDMDPSDAKLVFEGTRSRLEGALRTKDGDLLLTGSADWAKLDDWHAEIEAKMGPPKASTEAGTFESGSAQGGRGGATAYETGVLRVTIPALATLSAAPDVKAVATPKQVSLTGRVVVPEAQVKVETIPASSVSISSDAVMLNENLEPVKAPEPPIPFTSLVDVKLDRVLVDAFGLKAGLTGSLVAVQNPETGLGLSGEISIPGGRFRAYGQDLLIQNGRVFFSGPVSNPGLNIEAIRNPEATADDVKAGIRITGTAKMPKVEVFTDPAKSQEEALSYLLRGEGLDSLGESDGSMMTGMLLALGVSTGSQVLGAIGDTVGIENLGIDTTGVGDNAQVVVSGYVLPGLQVKYGIGIFDSLATLTLRYRLMPRLYLEAASGVDQALDFLYRFDFD